LRKKEAKLQRMKETRAAEETMLASMVLSENGARVLENAVADAERRVEKKKRAARDANAARPSVFVEPCDVCLALREVASKNVPNGKKDAAARTKLCSRCQVKARDLAIEAVRARRAAAKEAAEDLADAARRGELPAKDAATLASEERAREAHKRAMRDPTNARRGYDHLEKDLRATEKAVALAKTPEARVAALHRASALRVAMETATHERERELRRERVVAAMGARRKEGPMDEDEKWLV
jgi:hypothetical protein